MARVYGEATYLMGWVSDVFVYKTGLLVST